jgi:hypothetical protein
MTRSSIVSTSTGPSACGGSSMSSSRAESATPGVTLIAHMAASGHSGRGDTPAAEHALRRDQETVKILYMW